MKRISCCLLVTAVFFTAVTGCGKKTLKNDIDVMEGLQDIDKEHIFSEEDMSDLIEGADSIVYCDYVGGKIRIVYSYNEFKNNKYVSFNPDGSDLQTIDLPYGENPSVSECVADEAGNLYISYADYEDTDNEEASLKDCGIIKVDNSGNEISKSDLTNSLSGEDRYIHDMCWIPDVGVVFHTAEGIMVFNDQSGLSIVMDGKTVSEKIEDPYYELRKGANNRLFAAYFDKKDTQHLIGIDLKNKKFEKESAAINPGETYLFFGGEGYDLYAHEGYSIYGYDFESDKFTELVNIVDSEIGGNYAVGNLVAVNENEMIATMFDGDTKYGLSRLTKVNPEEIKDMTVITLCGVYIEPETVENTLKFNKNNDKYKIKVIDYADYYDDSPEDHFKLDISTGKVPDIFCFNRYVSGDMDNYISKGLIMDLTPSFADGGALGDIKVLPNIYEMMQTNGKVYTAIPSFSVETFVIRDRFAAGRTTLTLNECDELIKSNNTDYLYGFELYNRNDFLSKGVSLGGDTFVDYGNKKCNFDTPEFIDLLNFAKNLPDDISDSDYNFEMSSDELFADDRGIFRGTNLSDFYSYAELTQSVFKDDVAFIGFPNNAGKNEACIQSNMQYCISSSTKNSEGALEFLKFEFENYGLTDERDFAFPSASSKFEEAMKDASTPRNDGEGARIFSDDGDRIEAKPLTEDEVKKIYDYVTSVNTLYRFDNKLDEIISEEASAFFSGQKSAEDVAKIIQKRVSTYLNENG